MRVRNRKLDHWQEDVDEAVYHHPGLAMVFYLSSVAAGVAFAHFVLHGNEFMGASIGWFIGLFFLSLGIRRARIKRVRQRGDFCQTCGYDLRGSPDRCPECGTPNPSAISFY